MDERTVQRSTAAGLASELVSQFESAARKAIAARGRFTCALTGGSTAKLLYPSLARADVDWRCVELFLGDERLVPADDPESNGRLLAATFPLRVLHRVRTELPGDDAARDYEGRLPAELDVVHLGVGPDGHVCSLFPGHALLSERSRRVSWLSDSPKPPPGRVTLTLEALSRARELWFFAMGAEKATAVREAREGRSPAALARAVARRAAWFVDDAAAGAA
ncbi:MAG: 6-phosphogluconolactonase [Myxococcaceae bacterium]|nr:6-phosphogluconolactonase [Myxococcaceae bacterium]